MCGMFPGGATVPGRALIDTLPLVWQIDVVCVLWQVGRAAAIDGTTNPPTAKADNTPATADFEQTLMRPSPSVLRLIR